MKKKRTDFPSIIATAVGGRPVVCRAGGRHCAGRATRVIYPQGSKQTSLPIINSSASNVFLIQSWVANADGSRSTDFIITPPLFVIQPKKKIYYVLCMSGRHYRPIAKAYFI